jgi:cation diffusion facilitator CzcD-associated flavoprotein CzcO
MAGTEDNELRVAIIGAGVAGCAAAAALQDYGINFVVYEKQEGAGGLWAHNYPGASGTCHGKTRKNHVRVDINSD